MSWFNCICSNYVYFLVSYIAEYYVKASTSDEVCQDEYWFSIFHNCITYNDRLRGVFTDCYMPSELCRIQEQPSSLDMECQQRNDDTGDALLKEINVILD